MIIDKKSHIIEKLNSRLINCNQCRLSSTRKHVLVGEGYVYARLMIIALSPGEMEDSENQMFIGPSGHILNKLFSAAGINRKSVYMTNLIKCMLPKNRRPKMDEIEACSQYLDEEIVIINPEVIVPLGFCATRYTLYKYHRNAPNARAEFAELYGQLIFSEKQKIFPLPHPTSLIYNPSDF